MIDFEDKTEDTHKTHWNDTNFKFTAKKSGWYKLDNNKIQYLSKDESFKIPKINFFIKYCKALMEYLRSER